MALLIMMSHPFTLFSQTSVCPEYSFCLEVDEENCTIEVRLNGVANVPILGIDLRILFWDNAPPIDITATTASFESTAIWNHFSNQQFPLPPVFVSDDFVFIQYFPYADPNLSPFTPDEDCLYLGTIYFNPGELDCDDEIFSYAYQLQSRNSPGPQIWVGNNFPFDYQTCTNFSLDCECNDCPEDWGICMLPDTDPCGNVIPVFLTGLADEEIAGYRFNMVFDPSLVIDEDATRDSWLNSNLGSYNWGIKGLSVSYASNGTFLEVFGINLSGINPTVIFNSEFLLNIHIIPKLGECYKFDENSVSFWFPSGIWKGESFQDGFLCENFGWTCADFEVCFESIVLSGNVERPTVAGSCDEGIDFGFPEGKVTARGTYCGYESEFTTITGSNGYYEIEVFDGADYDVIPSYTEAHKYACGVNSIDIDIVNQVNLGLLPEFPFPFSNIAADMNVSGTVTGFDNVYIWRYINEVEYPPGGKWRFLPSSQYNSVFVPQSPIGTIVPAYDTMIHYVAGNPNTNNLNFIAVKMGDVNGSCQQCLEGGSLQEDEPNLLIAAKYYPSEERLGLYFKDIKLENVTVINLAIDGGNGIKLLPDKADKVVTDSEIILSGEGALGVNRGWISLKESGKTLKHGAEIASFRVEDFQYTSELTLTFGELVSDGRLYHLMLDRSEIEIIVEGGNNDQNPLSIAPNPGTDEILVSLEELNGEMVKLQIVDMMGRVIGQYQLPSEVNTINTASLLPVLTIWCLLLSVFMNP